MRKEDICPTWCEHGHRLGKERLSTKSVEAGGQERQVRTVGTHSSCWEPALASPSIECLGLQVTWSGMNLAMTANFTWNWASYVISPSFNYLTCKTGMAIAPNADELIPRPLILLVILFSNQWMWFIYMSFKIQCPRLALCNLTMGYAGWGVSPSQFRRLYPINGTSNCINLYDCQLFLMVFTKHLRRRFFFLIQPNFLYHPGQWIFFPKDIINFIFLCNVWLSSLKFVFFSPNFLLCVGVYIAALPRWC